MLVLNQRHCNIAIPKVRHGSMNHSMIPYSFHIPMIEYLVNYGCVVSLTPAPSHFVQHSSKDSFTWHLSGKVDVTVVSSGGNANWWDVGKDNDSRASRTCCRLD